MTSKQAAAIAGAVAAALIACVFTYKNAYQLGYDENTTGGREEGYNEGLEAGKAEGKAGADSEAYYRGYTEGMGDMLLDYDKYTGAVKAVLYGELTATVRDILPDYTDDSKEKRCLVLSLGNEPPIAVCVPPAICKAVKTGETYSFVLEPQEVVDIPKAYIVNSAVDKRVMRSIASLKVMSVRAATESECGNNCFRVKCEESQ